MSTRNKVILIVAFLVIAAGWNIFVGYSSRCSSDRFSQSTYSAGKSGSKALYMVLEELGLPVERLRSRFLKLRGHNNVLIIASPARDPFRRREMDQLKDWVGRGNLLVIFDRYARKSAGKEQKKKSTGAKEGAPAEDRSYSSPARYFGLSLKKASGKGPRATVEATLPGFEERFYVSVAGGQRWKNTPSGWTMLLEDKAGPILLSKDVGRGKVMAVADASIISNDALRNEQNLGFVLAMILRERLPGRIMFDEYHQGHSVPETMWSYVGGSVFGLVAFQGMLGLGLFFYSRRASVVGRYRSLKSAGGRSSMDYVDSMANVFESCQAGPAALEAVLKRFSGRLSRRTGIPVRLLSDSALAGISLPSGEGGDLALLIRDCRRVAESRDDSPEALTMARRLVRADRSLSLR